MAIDRSWLPVHLSQTLDPFARGREFGQRQRHLVSKTIRAYDSLFAEAGLADKDVDLYGSRYGDWLTRFYPELADEMKGVAEGADVSISRVAALNARTELLTLGSAPSECSTVASGMGRSSWLVQNWDWDVRLRDSRVLWCVPLAEGRWFATFTEAGILAKIGLNSDGLAIGLNMMRSAWDKPSDALPIHLLLRVLLESRSGTRAVEFARSVAVSASSCITILSPEADRGPIAVERSPRESEGVQPAAGSLFHTNHPLGPRAKSDNVRLSKQHSPTSEARLEVLRRIGAPEEIALAEGAMRVHAGEGSICRHAVPGSSTATLASLVLRPGDGTMTISDGPPCTGTRVTISPQSLLGRQAGAAQLAIPS